MDETTRRIMISCAVISIIACICLTGFAVLGGAALIPLARSASNQGTPTQDAVQVVPPTQEATRQPPEATETADDSPTEVETESAGPTAEATPDDKSPSETPAGQALPPEVSSEMDSIEAEVRALRGLESSEPVGRTLITPEELRQHFEEDFAQDYSPEEARDDVFELAALGLLEPDFDFYNFYIDFLTEGVAGYYDSEEQTMYVVQGEVFGGNERFTYAHEYTHALQDQTWDIEEGLEYTDEVCDDDSERCAGIQALIEGDASLAGLAWLTTEATDQDLRDIQEFYATYDSPVYDSAPEFLKEDFTFPYQPGMEFVQALFSQGGWDAVDAAYANPPISTEQILHPERYPDDVPQQVELPDVAAALGDGWRELVVNNIGEWYTYLILAKGLDAGARISENQARAAAEGWGGDTYTVFYNDETDQTVLVSKFVWDTPRDADQFNDTFRQWNTNRFGNPTAESGGVTTWQGEPGVTMFAAGEQETIWILAPDQALAQSLLALLNP